MNPPALDEAGYRRLVEQVPAVETGQVQVQQDEVGRGGARIPALAPQVGQRGTAVADHDEVVAQLVVRERLTGEHDVAGVVLDQQNPDGMDGGVAIHGTPYPDISPGGLSRVYALGQRCGPSSVRSAGESRSRAPLAWCQYG